MPVSGTLSRRASAASQGPEVSLKSGLPLEAPRARSARVVAPSFLTRRLRRPSTRRPSRKKSTPPVPLAFTRSSATPTTSPHTAAPVHARPLRRRCPARTSASTRCSSERVPTGRRRISRSPRRKSTPHSCTFRTGSGVPSVPNSTRGKPTRLRAPNTSAC